MRKLLLGLMLCLPLVAAVAAAQPVATPASEPRYEAAEVVGPALPAAHPAPAALKVSPVWPLDESAPPVSDQADADGDQDSWGPDHESPGAIPAFATPKLQDPGSSRLRHDPAGATPAPTRELRPDLRPPRG